MVSLDTDMHSTAGAVERVMTDKNGDAIKDNNGNVIYTREYHYTRADGSEVVIQDHSAGHTYGEEGVGDQEAHLNLRPIINTRTGSVSGAEEHYLFNK